MQQDNSGLVENSSWRCPCWRVGQDSDYFHLVKALSESGIKVYLTGTQHLHHQTSESQPDYAMVIDNVNSREFLAVNIINELANYKNTCSRCLNVMKRAQEVLNYYNSIKKNNILGICSDCSAMRRKISSCDKCDDLVKKFRAWKRRFIEDVGQKSSDDLELEKHRKLQKHHSLDTFLTSIDKNQRKATKNFAYLFPEELKKKSKSSVDLNSYGNKSRTKDHEEGDRDEEKRKKIHRKKDQDIPKNNLLAEWSDEQKSKRRQYDDHDDPVDKRARGNIDQEEQYRDREGVNKHRSKKDRVVDIVTSKIDSKDTSQGGFGAGAIGKSKRDGKESYKTANIQRKGDDGKHQGADGYKHEFKKEQFTDKEKEQNIDITNKKIRATKILKENESKLDPISKAVKELSKSNSKKDKGIKVSKPGKGLEETIFDQDTGVIAKVKKDKSKTGSKEVRGSKTVNSEDEYNYKHDQGTGARSKGSRDKSKTDSKQVRGSKNANSEDEYNNKHDTGVIANGNKDKTKTGSKQVRGSKTANSEDEDNYKHDQGTGVIAKGYKDKSKTGSKQVRGSKTAYSADEDNYKHDQGTVVIAKGNKYKSKAGSKQVRGSKTANSEDDKHEQESKTSKHGKKVLKQDQDADVSKRRKGKGEIDGNENTGRGKGYGDQKDNNKTGNRERKFTNRDKTEKLRKQANEKFNENDPRGVKKLKDTSGEGDIGDLSKKSDTSKGQESIKEKKKKKHGSKIGDDGGKAKPRASEVLLKQIHAQRSVLENKIADLVKVKGKDKNMRPKPPSPATDMTRFLNKKIKFRIIDSDDDLSIGEVLCENKSVTIDEFIVGDIITNVRPLLEEEKDVGVRPLLFKTKVDDETIKDMLDIEIAERPVSAVADKDQTPGIMHYALSDRQFIDMGWTLLPTEKVVRKMNVYRMRPAHPEFDWFERNKNKKLLFYDTGEKMAEFDENGRGRWFYRNGRLALNYYEAEEVNAQQRFVIYSKGEADAGGRSRPVAVLAMFDYLGNGLVLDNAGQTRLKYNQTEGVILDKSLGPISHWKWHTLNDPPVLQRVMMDTQLSHKDQDILQLGAKSEFLPRLENEDMLAIEFDNFIKEKSKKLAQTFKPFQIKMKALKINEHFSLKVLDQASVYLIYRDGTTNIKLNIGMILDHKEIVDTDTADLGDVSNSVERFPARTGSLEAIQRSVANAQRVEAAHVGLERRLRPPLPVASVDRLTSAVSKPLRLQMRVASTTPCCPNLAAKKNMCPSNLYYETHIC